MSSPDTAAGPAAAARATQATQAAALRQRSLLALAVGALGLRPLLLGIGPLIPDLRVDLGLSHGEAGLLSTITILGMGVFATLAPGAVRRFGSRQAVALCLGLLVVAGLARAAAPSALGVILLSVPLGLGMGVAGAVMPVFVKERFAIDPAFATGIYTTAIQVGSIAAVALAAPLALLLGGWRGALAAFSLVVAGVLGGWLLLTTGDRVALAPAAVPQPAPAGRRPRPRPWRSPMAWWLALLYWLSAVPFFGLMTWLPAAYVERGWSEIAAGELTAVVGLGGLPATLLVAWLADRWGSRRFYLLATSAVYVVAGIGLIVTPGLAWVCAALAGGAMGALFTLTMTLPLDVSHDSARAGGMVSLMLTVGYILTAITPTLLGGIRDLTGSFTTSFWVMVAAGIVLLVACAPLSPGRLARARSSP